MEVLAELYCGEPTGRTVYHVSEASRAEHPVPSPIRCGCPLGRGYTYYEALRDFCTRANHDDAGLQLCAEELVVLRTVDRRS